MSADNSRLIFFFGQKASRQFLFFQIKCVMSSIVDPLSNPFLLFLHAYIN